MKIDRTFAAMAGLLLTLATSRAVPLQGRSDPPPKSKLIDKARSDLNSAPGEEVYANATRFPATNGTFIGNADFNPKEKRKRSLAYWPLWEALAAIEATQEPIETFEYQQLDHLTHLILFGINANELNATSHGIDWVNPAARVFPKDIAKRARDEKKLKVMVAIGGWEWDALFWAVQTDTQAENLGKHIAGFAKANGFDGVWNVFFCFHGACRYYICLLTSDCLSHSQIDIDHEYPTAAQADCWPKILKQIREDAPKLLLSVALPGTPHTADSTKDPYAVGGKYCRRSTIW